MGVGICKECHKETEMHAHGKCYHCYRKNYKQPTVVCKVCGKETEHHAKGMCNNCAQKLFYYDNIRSYNVRKVHNIDLESWKEVTKKCVICGFDKIVDLHHVDKNRKNTSTENMIGLCPNHHRMLHDMRYMKEIEKLIKEKLNEKK